MILYLLKTNSNNPLTWRRGSQKCNANWFLAFRTTIYIIYHSLCNIYIYNITTILIWIVSADLAVWRLVGNCNMFSCGPRFPEGHPIQLPWRNGPSHQQEQQTPGRSLDGWFQRFLLHHITRYRARRLAAFINLLLDYAKMAWILYVSGNIKFSLDF